MNIVNVRFGIHDTLTPEQEELKNEIAMSKYKRTKSGIYTDGNFKWYSCGGEPFRFVREYEEFDYGQPSFRYEDVIAVGDTIGELYKDIAQILDIKGLDVDINKELTHITEKWLSHYVEKWDDFCFETMYEAYKRLGAGKVLVISETNFKEFLEWGIPRWNKHQEIEPILKDCIKLLKQEGSDTKQQVLEKLEELVK